MKITVKITKETIRESINCGGSPSNCAVARAVREIFPYALVTMYAIHFMGNSAIDDIKLPSKASDFIYEFDTTPSEDREDIKPLSFEIEVPEALIQKIGIGEVYRILSESKTLELVM